MTKKYAIMLFLVFLGNLCVAQNNDFQAGLYNVVSGSLIGGIGAIINKKPNQPTGNVLLKGLGQGALGGLISFQSKTLVRNFAKTGNYAYIWPSRLTNSLGNSIILNAAANRNFWERYYLDIGFCHLEFDLKRENRLQIRVLPFSFVGAVDGFVNGSFDFRRSLYTGVLFFKSSRFEQFGGWAFYNNISLNDSVLENRSNLIAHELIHVYQYQGLIGINSMIDKPLFFKDKTDFWKKYNSIFYTDWNALTHSFLYLMDKSVHSTHGERLHEREAAYYE